MSDFSKFPERGGGYILKAQNETFDWHELTQKGNAHAQPVILRVVEEQNPTLLWYAFQELPEDAGIRVGFFHRIAMALITASYRQPE